MEQRPFQEYNLSSVGQEIPHITCNPQVHYQVQKSLPVFPVWSLMNPVHTLPFCSRIMLILSSHLWLCLPSSLLPLHFSTKTVNTFFVSECLQSLFYCSGLDVCSLVSFGYNIYCVGVHFSHLAICHAHCMSIV